MTASMDLDRLLSSRFADALPELGVRWNAAPVDEPELLVLNVALAHELGLHPEFLRGPDGIGLLVGTTLPERAVPVAQAYAGHQFGGYVPRLGDGRALLLGELPDGRDLHLKGSGRTPFSRGGDGLAAVGPMLREYLVSEALHALGVPTTRSLAVVATGRPVYREQPLPGAVLSRVAASHLRVGSFQYTRATGDRELLQRLADHAIERHHPAAAASPNPYLALFRSVLDVQAALIARWMLVGFVHGVMNTDNTTISGETIDYGPCAFLDVFDPSAVFSSIDGQGRYAYSNQPIVAQWNLARFAETLIPLIADDDAVAVGLLTTELEAFPARYVAAWSAGMRDKLGLSRSTDRVAVDALIDDLGARLPAAHIDYTGFFRQLTAVALGEDAGSLADDETLGDWFWRWRDLAPAAESMVRSNPIYLPRNHLVEETLDAATAGDLGPFRQLLEVVTDPFTLRPGRERYAAGPPPEMPPHITYCGT